jgi:D-alanyl-lipoteichoic acid acyltransferase DltB (MBOAT superfamily)
LENYLSTERSTVLAIVDTNWSLMLGLVVAGASSIAISVWPRVRTLTVVSALGAVIYYGRAFLGFGIVAGVAYAVACWLGSQPDRTARWRGASLALLCLIVIFTVGRLEHWERAAILPGVTPFALFTLDMWLALRLVTLFWEVGSGRIGPPTPAGYVAWVCLPFTLAGPLIRYSQFAQPTSVNRSLWMSHRWWRDILIAAAKLAGGLGLYILQRVLVDRWPHAHLLNSATAALLTQPIGFYLTFAGYYHLMQVLGRPSGINLPDSFNFPIGRENISAFWANWNITVTTMFRDYLFYNRWGRRTSNVFLNTLVLFTLVGFWHATNAYWVMWGFLHGLLFCVFLLWTRYRICHTSPSPSAALVCRTAGRVLTYVCVCACWYLPSKILLHGWSK